MTSSLERARAAYDRQAWAEACNAFAAAADEAPLAADDHERFAVAAYLIGADARANTSGRRRTGRPSS